MNRRSFGVAALYAGALLVGTVAGGVAGVPSVHAKPAAVASQQDAAPEEGPQPAQSHAKRKPPTACKTTKDCPKDHVCIKAGDHKECAPTAIKPPSAPVVT